MARNKLNKKLEVLVDALKKDHDRWEEIKTIGCYDPFHTDGVNMEVKRGHIIFMRKEIQELCNQLKVPLPEIMQKPVPPKVDMDYMARPHEIVNNARDTLKIIKASKEYEQFMSSPICRAVQPLTVQRLEYLATEAEKGIDGNLIWLRIFEKRPEHMLSELRSGLAKAEAHRQERGIHAEQLCFAF